MKSPERRNLLSPVNCTSLRIRQFSRLVARFYDAEMARAGIKTSQFSLLTAIANRGPIASGLLAQRMVMSASTLTRNLSPLIANGWVERLSAEDGRSKMVVITHAGRAKQLEAQSCWTDAQTRLNTTVGIGKVHALQTLIEDFSASLKAT